MRVAFFGTISHAWQSSYQRLDCLRQTGAEVRACNTGASGVQLHWGQRIWRKLAYAPFSDRELQRYNEGVAEACTGRQPEVVWLEWPLLLARETLLGIRERWPGSTIVCFQDDNPFDDRLYERPRWRRFIDNIPLYDVHFVKRPFDVTEFGKRGAKRALLFTHGVYEPLFHPDPRPDGQRGPPIPVSFVGTARDHRVECISNLIGQHRIPVRVFGSMWERHWVRWRHRSHFSTFVLNEAYSRVIWDSKISLAFVSSRNRDEYTMRTFEIPGSGGFFLAERTPKHQELYEEGREAEFFGSPEECASKIAFYLRNEEARCRIAAAGRERCIRSNYSLTNRMRDALAQLFPTR